MKKLVLVVISLAVMFSGCTGVVSGHTYTKDDVKVIYKVVKEGVVTFVSEEQIKKLHLDTTDKFIVGTYKLVEGNDVKLELEKDTLK